MDFEDKDIYALIEKIGVHYNQNVANRYIRPVLGAVLAESEFSGDCTALTERFEQYQYQGYYLDDLYRQILALFKLCEKIEKISNVKYESNMLSFTLHEAGEVDFWLGHGTPISHDAKIIDLGEGHWRAVPHKLNENQIIHIYKK